MRGVVQWLVITAVGLGGAIGDARAAEVAGPLQWSAPAGCPDRDVAAAMLNAQLRGPLPEALGVQVVLAEARSGYVATIAITGAEDFAARTLVAGDCEALARAAILVVAVAIDPVAVVGPTDPVDPVGPMDPPSLIGPIGPTPKGGAAPERSDGERGVSRAADRTATPPPSRRGPSRWGHALRIAGGVGAQIVPTVMGAVQLGHVAIARLWRIETTATWLPPARRRYADGAGVRVQAFTLGVRACPSPRLGRVTLPVCLGMAGGSAIGRGTDVRRTTVRASGWLAVEVGVAAVIAVHPRVGVLVGVDGSAALLRPAFHLGTRPDVLATPSLGGRGLVGIEVRLR